LPRVRRQSIAAFRQIASNQVRTDPRSERYDRAKRLGVAARDPLGEQYIALVGRYDARARTG
jgi:hypothetical protein